MHIKAETEEREETRAVIPCIAVEVIEIPSSLCIVLYSEDALLIIQFSKHMGS